VVIALVISSCCHIVVALTPSPHLGCIERGDATGQPCEWLGLAGRGSSVVAA